MHYLRSLLFTVLPSVATGQTFIVDAANGPGTNFLDLPAAVAAVPDGAVLVVRPGTYSEFQITAKGLTILGGPGVEVTHGYPSMFAIELANIGVTQAVTIRGITAATDGQLLRATDCVGPLLLEDLMGHPTCRLSVWSFLPGIELRDCSQVMLRSVLLPNSAVYAVDSHTVVEQCSITAPDGMNAGHGITLSPWAALDVRSGSASVTDSMLAGGDGGGQYTIAADAPAIGMTTALLRVQGGSSLHSGTWGTGPKTSPAIDGAGTLRLDPSVTLTASSTTMIGAGINTTLAPLADVLGHSAALGGSLAGEVRGPLGQFSILVVGFSGPPFVVPGIADPFWISSNDNAFITMGTPAQGTPLVANVPVPLQVGLRGLVLAWQSAAVGPSGLEASNPTWTLVQ